MNISGAPKKYQERFGDIIIDIAKQGGHQAQMMMAIGDALGQSRPISPDTLSRWRKEYKEFEDAYQSAKICSQAFYENLALQGVLGNVKNFNPTTFAMIMNAKFCNEYKRAGATVSIEPAQTTINIVQLTPEQLKYKIAQKQALLKQRGQSVELDIDDPDCE